MTAGAWVLLAAVVAAAASGCWWTLTNGVFRGTHRVRDRRRTVVSTSSTDDPTGDPTEDRTRGSVARSAGGTSVLVGTAYDARRGERATLLQFSSAFCAPCRATRRTLAQVAGAVPGVTHVEIDAEAHLDLVRELGVVRTPTTLVLDAGGCELARATGAPRAAQVLSALEAVVA